MSKPTPINYEELAKKRVITPRDLETQVFDFATVQWFIGERFSFGISLMPPGGGHEKHSHPGIEEVLYVISGEMDEVFYPEEKKYHVTPGSFVHIPPGKEHATEVVSWEPVKVLAIYVPAGPEKELREACDTVLPPGAIPKYTYK